MDIHRCRFVPYPTSAINAVAFSCSQLTGRRNANLVRLAIGRANGDIEIWVSYFPSRVAFAVD